MGIFKRMWERDKREEEMLVRNAILANQLAAEQRRMTTCKKCKKIFAEGYPYQKTIFGKPKTYVCKDCAKELGLI